jgi:hypothetical protein
MEHIEEVQNLINQLDENLHFTLGMKTAKKNN